MERDQGPTTVEFENTVDDFVKFEMYWYTHKSKRKYWFGYALSLATGLAMGQGLAGPRVTARSIVYYAVCSAILLVAWSVFIYGLTPLIARRTMRRQAVKFLGVVGRRCISLEMEGVRETSGAIKTMIAWHAVEAIEEDKDHIYIYLIGGTGWVVPRRALLSPAAADEFFGTARRLLAQGARRDPVLG